MNKAKIFADCITLTICAVVLLLSFGVFNVTNPLDFQPGRLILCIPAFSVIAATFLYFWNEAGTPRTVAFWAKFFFATGALVVVWMLLDVAVAVSAHPEVSWPVATFEYSHPLGGALTLLAGAFFGSLSIVMLIRAILEKYIVDRDSKSKKEKD